MLVHHTGTMIRFTTSQLPTLPSADRNIRIELPDHTIVAGHFRRNPANPNVSGPALVRYIKGILKYGHNKHALIDVSGALWRVYDVGHAVHVMSEAQISTSRVRNAQINGHDLAALLKLADKSAAAPPRRAAYERLLRPPALRRLILDLMGPSCQVQGCKAAQSMAEKWHDSAAGVSILEVHHIEAIARKVDHHPRNLCVLCANHHALIHGYGPWEIAHRGDEVILSVSAESIRIVRDLGFLRAAP